METNLTQVFLNYYIKNKKGLLEEAIRNDRVEVSNALIRLYREIENVVEPEEVAEEKEKEVIEEVNLSEIFARKLR